MWDKRRPGDPREAAFLWVPGGSSAEPQGLRHTHTEEPADLAALDLTLSPSRRGTHPGARPPTLGSTQGLASGRRALTHTKMHTNPLPVTQARPASPRPCQSSFSRPLSHNPRRAGWPPLTPLIPPDAPRLAASWPNCPGSHPQRAKARQLSPPSAPYSSLWPKHCSVSGAPQPEAQRMPAETLSLHSHSPQQFLVFRKRDLQDHPTTPSAPHPRNP